MWKMSFCDSDQKSMPIVGFLTCNGSGIFCGPKLIPIGGLDTELISRLQRPPGGPIIPNPHILEAWHPGPCHLRLWRRICITLFPLPRISTEYEATFHIRVSPRRRWPDGAYKPSTRAIPTRLHELPTGQLGTTPPSGGVCIQQRR